MDATVRAAESEPAERITGMLFCSRGILDSRTSSLTIHNMEEFKHGKEVVTCWPLCISHAAEMLL